MDLLTTSQAANLLEVPVSDIGRARRFEQLECVADHECDYTREGHLYHRDDVMTFGRRTQHPGGIALSRPGVECRQVRS